MMLRRRGDVKGGCQARCCEDVPCTMMGGLSCHISASSWVALTCNCDAPPDANLKNPKDYWDYENLSVEWG